MKKILIIGCNCEIGKSFIKKLSKNNLIYGTYNSSKPEKKNKKIKYFKLNLLKPILHEKKFDVLIYLASLTPKKKYSLSDYMKINYHGMKKILEQLDKKHLKKIILTSTTNIYGFKKNGQINESYISPELSFYAKSKYKMETYLSSFSKKNIINYYIYRIPGIVGGEYNNNFIINLIKKIKNNEDLNLFNQNSKFNNVIHVNNLCDIIIDTLKIDKNLILNVGTKYPLKIKSLVKYVIAELKKKKIIFNKKINFNKSKQKSFYLNLNKTNKFTKKILSTKETLFRIID